ncbi:MAG: cytochrome P450 [Pelatocladus maniniholoensis HA4357-MV3]|jgi:cytochrome P450|uniref:Cytochrome P450 n=1 Tax=Pelatocladus maniniholoensis HA4357-MV3 TaxID=1117104 RepID=A0A9E3H8J3_9NOST|nr:cytochrome P450 [Pelatocladus maniniholoensis HA4357-MV3]
MKLPNGPKTPSLVQIFQWINSPLTYMENCAERYGDIFTLQLTEPVVMISNPQGLQQMLTSDTKEFAAPGDPLFESFVGKNSVITVSGEVHRRQRQLLMPPFHGERMRSYAQVISNVTEEIISQWQIAQKFDVHSAMQVITMRVIMQAVFGLYDSPHAQELEKLLTLMLNRGGSSPLRALMLYFPVLQKDLGPLTPWGTFLRRRSRVYQLLHAEIQARREQADSSRTDVLSLLIAARDEAGQPMTDAELSDELMTLLTAGHETTATALTWVLYWIHKLPEVREKLLQELDTIGDRSDSNTSSSTILKLPYLNAVCSESLRIYPVGMLTFPRVVKQSLTLCGYDLEPGTRVLGSIYLTHQREDLYPVPKQFKPERFIEKQFSPYEFLPFGGGAKRCIGDAFAQFEMRLVLATILSRLELALVYNSDVKPKRRGLVTGPDRPIQMVVNNRRQVESRTPEAISR